MSWTVTSSTGIVANRPIAPSITTWRLDGRWAGRRELAGASIRHTLEQTSRRGRQRAVIERAMIGGVPNAVSDAPEQLPPPAHRPSRRNQIIDAAIRQFARKGFVDASISDVADEADVAVTAVYYHFSGKEELFGAAVDQVFRSITDVVDAARGDKVSGDPKMLDAV